MMPTNGEREGEWQGQDKSIHGLDQPVHIVGTSITGSKPVVVCNNSAFLVKFPPMWGGGRGQDEPLQTFKNRPQTVDEAHLLGQGLAGTREAIPYSTDH